MKSELGWRWITHDLDIQSISDSQTPSSLKIRIALLFRIDLPSQISFYKLMWTLLFMQNEILKLIKNTNPLVKRRNQVYLWRFCTVEKTCCIILYLWNEIPPNSLVFRFVICNIRLLIVYELLNNLHPSRLYSIFLRKFFNRQSN